MPDTRFSAILRALRPDAQFIEARPAGGGGIHAAYRIDTDSGPLFLKTGTLAQAAQFEAEAAGLARIAKTGAVRTPAVLGHGVTGDHAWLALEWLDLVPLDPAGGEKLGAQLAALHRHTQENFGLDHHNFLGRTPQDNTPQRQWPWFFAHHRLQPQLRQAIANGLERKLAEQCQILVEKLPAFFVDRRVRPALLHGDLWHGNAAMLADGTPVIFDPAIYYGDAEADLAMAELFGGFPESFYASYRQALPPVFGFERRKTLYNLYHMLNHYNLFGDSYLSQIRRMTAALMSDLRR